MAAMSPGDHPAARPRPDDRPDGLATLVFLGLTAGGDFIWQKMPLRQAAADDQGRGQGGLQAVRGRPARQGQAEADPHAAQPPADDAERAQGHGHRHQPDPLFGRPALRADRATRPRSVSPRASTPSPCASARWRASTRCRSSRTCRWPAPSTPPSTSTRPSRANISTPPPRSSASSCRSANAGEALSGWRMLAT